MGCGQGLGGVMGSSLCQLSSRKAQLSGLLTAHPTLPAEAAIPQFQKTEMGLAEVKDACFKFAVV